MPRVFFECYYSYHFALLEVGVCVVFAFLRLVIPAPEVIPIIVIVAYSVMFARGALRLIDVGLIFV